MGTHVNEGGLNLLAITLLSVLTLHVFPKRLKHRLYEGDLGALNPRFLSEIKSKSEKTMNEENKESFNVAIVAHIETLNKWHKIEQFLNENSKLILCKKHQKE